MGEGKERFITCGESFGATPVIPGIGIAVVGTVKVTTSGGIAVGGGGGPQ